MKKLIQVTVKDICKGVAKDGKTCPIALAVTREVGPKQFIYVQTNGNVTYDGIVTLGSTRVRRFIKAFDAGRQVKPFRFWLNTKEA